MSSQYGAVLREGLAAEFPSAKRAVDRLVVALRSPQVGREAPLWAAISAFGADWAVGAIGQVLAIGLRVAGLHDPGAWLSGGSAILGYALAVAVALRAGGRRGLGWYLAILAVRIGMQIAISVAGFATFCERSGECSLVRLVVPYLYVAAGLVLGPVASRVVRTGPAHPNAFLSGAGAFLLLAALANLAFFFGAPQDPARAPRPTRERDRGRVVRVFGAVRRLSAPRWAGLTARRDIPRGLRGGRGSRDRLAHRGPRQRARITAAA